MGTLTRTWCPSMDVSTSLKLRLATLYEPSRAPWTPPAWQSPRSSSERWRRQAFVGDLLHLGPAPYIWCQNLEEVIAPAGTTGASTAVPCLTDMDCQGSKTSQQCFMVRPSSLLWTSLKVIIRCRCMKIQLTKLPSAPPLGLRNFCNFRSGL